MGNDQTHRHDQTHLDDQSQFTTDRFRLPPGLRVPLTASMSFLFGLIYGMHSSYARTGQQYLVENSHRLPKTKGGWYWYYKRKNWVCLQGAVKGGVKLGLKTGGFTLAVFGLEAMIDKARGRIDCLSTIATSVLVGTAYSRWRHLNRSATVSVLRKGLVLGVVGGVLQDALMMARGVDAWGVSALVSSSSSSSSSSTLKLES